MSFQNPKNRTALAASTVALLMTASLAMPAWSQSGATSSGSTAMMKGTTNTMADTAPAGSIASGAPEAKVARGDASMLKDLAQGNMGEIDAGKMALEKSQNADVKKFAQMMIDDHTKALGEVTALAQAKGVVLPDGPGVKAKTKATALKAMSGKLFDKEYAKHAGVGDHEQTVKLLKKIQKNGKDADLKALADKLLPKVEGHLGEAKTLVAATANSKS
ncbi:MAG: DUF4142 domain-containing protein [Pseudomonadota bacterium]